MLLLIICVASMLHLTTITGIPAPATTTVAPTTVPAIRKEYFLYHYVQANWHNAYLFCRENGMQLATIKSKEELDYLSERIADLGLSTDWWISGSDQGQDGQDGRFSWFPVGALLKFENFDENQPDNAGGNEECVHIRPNNRWNDAKCELELRFVCEREL